MIIGVPKEIKKSESRVSMTPSGVAALVHQGHQVLVETNAGLGAGFSDDAYLDEGAQIVATAKEAWSAELVVKVKEPLPAEYLYFREGLILYTYLHLAADKELTHHLLEKRVVSIAYETIQLADGSLPLLAPMSEIAGRLSITEGAYHLKKLSGGKGILLSGVPGVERARVLIIGGGVAGTNAAKIAIGIGAKVEIVDNNIHRLRELDDIFGSTIETIYSTPKNIATHIK
ncbi:MAG: alanine dehydrogenase, partial [Enterococcus sp.]